MLFNWFNLLKKRDILSISKTLKWEYYFCSWSSIYFYPRGWVKLIRQNIISLLPSICPLRFSVKAAKTYWVNSYTLLYDVVLQKANWLIHIHTLILPQISPLAPYWLSSNYHQFAIAAIWRSVRITSQPLSSRTHKHTRTTTHPIFRNRRMCVFLCVCVLCVGK